MEMRLTRWIDKRVGDVCIRALSRLAPGRPAPERPRTQHVVVTKYLGLGSLLMATPLLQFLKQRSPAPRITLVTLRQNAAFARLLPFVDDVILVDRSTLWRFATSTVAALRALRRLAADVLFDLEFFSRYSALVAFASGAPTRVGFTTADNPRGRLLTHGIEIDYPHEHISSAFLSLAVRLLPAGAERPRFELFDIRERLPLEAFAGARSRLAALGIEDFVLFNAAGGEAIGAEREWRAAEWAALAAQVHERLGLDVIFTGDRSQRHQVADIVSRCTGSGVHDLSGQTSLLEFLAMIGLARAVVTIDSAALHVAASLETPTVSLHGPEPPSVHAYGGPLNRAVYKGLSGHRCPCFAFFDNKSVDCRHQNQCMRAIEVPDVAAALDEVLAAARGAAQPLRHVAG